MQLIMHIVNLLGRRLFVLFVGKTLCFRHVVAILKKTQNVGLSYNTTLLTLRLVDGEDAEVCLEEPELVEYQQRLALISL